MKKSEYIEMLITDNKTSGNKQKLFSDVIDCTDIALSQMPEDFEVDGSVGLEALYRIIEEEGRKSACHCVGPFEAAELIAKKLGATYIRASLRPVTSKIVKLEDLF